MGMGDRNALHRQYEHVIGRLDQHAQVIESYRKQLTTLQQGYDNHQQNLESHRLAISDEREERRDRINDIYVSMRRMHERIAYLETPWWKRVWRHVSRPVRPVAD